MLFLVVFNEWKRDSGHKTFKIRKHCFTIRVIEQQDQFAQTGCDGSVLEGLQGLNGHRPEQPIVIDFALSRGWN